MDLYTVLREYNLAREHKQKNIEAACLSQFQMKIKSIPDSNIKYVNDSIHFFKLPKSKAE